MRERRRCHAAGLSAVGISRSGWHAWAPKAADEWMSVVAHPGIRDPSCLAAMSHPVKGNSKCLCGIPRAPHRSFHVIQAEILVVDPVIPILQMSKVRHRKVV